MTCNVKHGVACLPVTALHAIEHRNVTLLFSNEGSSLCVRCVERPDIILRQSIFRSQNIHGIITSFSEQHDITTIYHLVVWGGRTICVCKLIVRDEEFSNPKPLLQLYSTKPWTIDDWIMTVSINKSHSHAVLLTAHNALYFFELVSNYETPLKLLGRGMTTLLYSGVISVVDDGRFLIASGTIFGEVIVWTCHRTPLAAEWKSMNKHMFTGHKGSIFGVAISDSISFQGQQYRILASCSDDRTIRIWDISGCEDDITRFREEATACYSTAYGSDHDQNLQLSVAWGHSSRIWGIYFLNAGTESRTAIDLVSRGEDGMCQFWQLQLCSLFESKSSTHNVLQALSNDRHHIGKNAWSLAASSSAQKLKIYTGGADGQIVSRGLPAVGEVVNTSFKFPGVVSRSMKSSARALKQYLTFRDGSVIATTDTGELTRSHVTDLRNWELVFQPTEETTLILCKNSSCKFAFYCLADRTLSAYNISENSSLGTLSVLPASVTWMQVAHIEKEVDEAYTVHLVAKLYGELCPRLITITIRERRTDTTMQKICLPSDFDVVSAIFLRRQKALVCGSRAGALAVFPVVDIMLKELNHGMIVRHVHGSDSVTAIIALAGDSESRLSTSAYILTTGRDGTFAVHHLHVEVSGAKLNTLHRATLPLGPNIEGASIISSGTHDQALVFHGFKSKDFVVWDETHQIQLLSVDCGGAHRSWHYVPGNQNTEWFVWTKAGAFNSYYKCRRTHEIIQRGNHGREIKALAVSKWFNLLANDQTDTTPFTLIATGAEDTDIRLLKYSSTSLSHIAVLKYHTTGLQALKFSRCGHYLFSSGGVEEFVVWRLNKVPIIGIGALVLGVLPKNREDDDARIMSFDVRQQTLDETQSEIFTILLAYSNGKAKVFEFNYRPCNSLGRFTLLQQVTIGTLCLTQAQMLIDDLPPFMLVGATDGSVRFANMDITKDAVTTHRVHQSNIAAMSVQRLPPESYIIATGGDDNALAVTLLQKRGSQAFLKTLLVPKAHAAAVTAVSIVAARASSNESVYVVSAGNDQRVRLWCISGLSPFDHIVRKIDELPASLPQWDNVSLKSVQTYSTDVADISSIETVRYDSSEIYSLSLKVFVVGVGMQTMDLNIRENAEGQVLVLEGS